MAKLATAVRDLQENQSKVQLGFWIFLMSDLVLFGSLFATYAVLKNNTYGGPAAKDIFNLNIVLVETLVLLLSSYAIGLSLLAFSKKNYRQVLGGFIAVLTLGTLFLALELYEFSNLFVNGYSWQTSGFLSAYFGLVGMHGLHILIGLVWLAVLIHQVVKKKLLVANHNRLRLFSMYWHFLDLVWIFIFSVVYLMGSV